MDLGIRWQSGTKGQGTRAAVRRKFLMAAFAYWVLLSPVALPSQAPKGNGDRPSDQNLRAAFARAQQALAAKDYADAERGFKDFLKLDPNSAAAYTNLGVVYLRTAKPDEAIKVFEIARKLDPGMVGVDLNLGLAYYRKQDFSRALPYFQHVVAAEPASL